MEKSGNIPPCPQMAGKIYASRVRIRNRYMNMTYVEFMRVCDHDGSIIYLHNSNQLTLKRLYWAEKRVRERKPTHRQMERLLWESVRLQLLGYISSIQFAQKFYGPKDRKDAICLLVAVGRNNNRYYAFCTRISTLKRSAIAQAKKGKKINDTTRLSVDSYFRERTIYIDL